MGQANPDPGRITDELWRFILACQALEPGDTGPLYPYADKPGSHNTRRRLIAQGLTNDYSIRDPLNKEGPDDKCAAFDWISLSGQHGDRRIMNVYGGRARDAYARKDPRLFGVFEILTQVDAGVPEGYVLYPTRHVRTPDNSHDWHHHIGFLRKYLAHWPAFAGLLSVFAGEQLADWLAGKSVYLTTPTPRRIPDMLMGRTVDNPTVYLGDGFTRCRKVPNVALMSTLQAAGVPFLPKFATDAELFAALCPDAADAPATPVVLSAEQADRLGETVSGKIAELLAALPQGGTVDGAAVVTALRDGGFLAAVAKAVNDDAAERAVE